MCVFVFVCVCVCLLCCCGCCVCRWMLSVAGFCVLLLGIHRVQHLRPVFFPGSAAAEPNNRIKLECQDRASFDRELHCPQE